MPEPLTNQEPQETAEPSTEPKEETQQEPSQGSAPEETSGESTVETPDEEPSESSPETNANTQEQTPEQKRYFYEQRKLKQKVESEFGQGNYEYAQQLAQIHDIEVEDVLEGWRQWKQNQESSAPETTDVPEQDFSETPDPQIAALAAEVQQLKQRDMVSRYMGEKSEAIKQFPRASALSVPDPTVPGGKLDFVDVVVAKTGCTPVQAAKYVHNALQNYINQELTNYTKQKKAAPPTPEGGGGGNPTTPVDITKMNSDEFRDSVLDDIKRLYKP